MYKSLLDTVIVIAELLYEIRDYRNTERAQA